MRNLVFDVEYRRHFVSVRTLKSAGREADRLHQIRIQKAESLLLPGFNQKGTKDLDPVDIEKVFVIIPAPDAVLGSQFAVAAHAGKCLDKLFDGISPGRGEVFGQVRVDVDNTGIALSLLVDLDFGKWDGYRLHHYFQRFFMIPHQIDFYPLIVECRENQYRIFGELEPDIEYSFQVTEGSLPAVFDLYIDTRYWLPVSPGNFSGHHE